MLKVNKIILTFCLLLFFTNCLAQYRIGKTMIRTAALITFPDLPGASGSGFLYSYKGFIYLVTAKHVLFNPSGTLYDTTISFHTYDSNDSMLTFKLSLETFRKDGDVAVGKEGDDVAVVRVAKEITQESVYFPPSITYSGLSPNSTLQLVYKTQTRDLAKTHVGNDVFILGYPRSLDLIPGEYNFDFPLVRKGIVAGKNNKNNTIVTDCFVNHGNSGCPVIEIDAFDEGAKLVGIAVAFIPSIDTTPYKDGHSVETVTNSGYSIVEPIDKIDRLIESLK